MKNSMIALGALALLAGCNGSEEPDPAPEASSTPSAAVTDSAVAEEGASQAETPAPVAMSDRTTVSGTVDSLVLETDPPMVMLTGTDGTKYIGNVAASAADAVTDTIKGVGSKATLDCKPAKSPEGAEPGYTWLDDCKLAG